MNHRLSNHGEWAFSHREFGKIVIISGNNKREVEKINSNPVYFSLNEMVSFDMSLLDFEGNLF